MAKSEKESKVSEEVATPVAAPKAAPAPNTSSESSGKRKGKQPGRPPHKGKKLKAHIATIYAKVTKEGQVSLDKAITILKQVKRAKFDESIEIHMSLGIDSAQSQRASILFYQRPAGSTNDSCKGATSSCPQSQNF